MNWCVEGMGEVLVDSAGEVVVFVGVCCEGGAVVVVDGEDVGAGERVVNAWEGERVVLGGSDVLCGGGKVEVFGDGVFEGGERGEGVMVAEFMGEESDDGQVLVELVECGGFVNVDGDGVAAGGARFVCLDEEAAGEGARVKVGEELVEGFVE